MAVDVLNRWENPFTHITDKTKEVAGKAKGLFQKITNGVRDKITNIFYNNSNSKQVLSKSIHKSKDVAVDSTAKSLPKEKPKIVKNYIIQNEDVHNENLINEIAKIVCDVKNKFGTTNNSYFSSIDKDVDKLARIENMIRVLRGKLSSFFEKLNINESYPSEKKRDVLFSMIRKKLFSIGLPDYIRKEFENEIFEIGFAQKKITTINTKQPSLIERADKLAQSVAVKKVKKDTEKISNYLCSNEVLSVSTPEGVANEILKLAEDSREKSLKSSEHNLQFGIRHSYDQKQRYQYFSQIFEEKITKFFESFDLKKFNKEQQMNISSLLWKKLDFIGCPDLFRMQIENVLLKTSLRPTIFENKKIREISLEEIKASPPTRENLNPNKFSDLAYSLFEKLKTHLVKENENYDTIPNRSIFKTKFLGYYSNILLNYLKKMKAKRNDKIESFVNPIKEKFKFLLGKCKDFGIQICKTALFTLKEINHTN